MCENGVRCSFDGTEFRTRAYIERFAAAGKEHICATIRQHLLKGRITPSMHPQFNSQAPTTAKLVDIPPSPYVKLILGELSGLSIIVELEG